MNAYERMIARIDAEPELEAHRDTLTYDWPNAEEHYEWVATAELTEIISWCIAVSNPRA